MIAHPAEWGSTGFLTFEPALRNGLGGTYLGDGVGTSKTKQQVRDFGDSTVIECCVCRADLPFGTRVCPKCHSSAIVMYPKPGSLYRAAVGL